MASKTKLTFIDKGFRDILSSAGTKSVIDETANRIALNAGAGYEANSSYYGQGHRWIGFVHTTDTKSMRDEAEHKTLTKAVR